MRTIKKLYLLNKPAHAYSVPLGSKVISVMLDHESQLCMFLEVEPPIEFIFVAPTRVAHVHVYMLRADLDNGLGFSALTELGASGEFVGSVLHGGDVRHFYAYVEEKQGKTTS